MSETPLNQIVDTHYSGWLGILPDEIWSIIFKMVHQMNMKDIHKVVTSCKMRRECFEGVDKYNINGAYVFEKEFWTILKIKQKQKWLRELEEEHGPTKQHSFYIDNGLFVDYGECKLLYSLTSEVKSLKEQCKQNGLKGYSRKTKTELIKMLMSI